MKILNTKSALLLSACLGVSSLSALNANAADTREGDEFYCATKVCVDVSFACWMSKITCKPASETHVRITYRSRWLPELGGSAYFFQDQNYRVIGNDYINTIVLKGTGNDTIRAMGGTDIVVAGAGDDMVSGDAGDDLIYGDRMPLFNNDDGGNDDLDGGTGNDVIYGGLGNDDIVGGDGNDTLFGAEGVDTLTGNAGNDILYGGVAADSSISGGPGSDSFVSAEVDEVQDFDAAEGDIFLNDPPIPEGI